MNIKRIIPEQIKSLLRYGLYAKRKNCKKNKIKLVFCMSRSELFNSYKSIFESAVKDPMFEPYILTLPRNYMYDKKSDYDLNYEYCLKILDPKYIIKAYDEKNDSFISVDEISPDYFFVDVPYSPDYPEQYKTKKILSKTKICYSSYGYTMEKNRIQNISVNSNITGFASFVFCNNDIMYKKYRKTTWLSEILFGKRIYNIGFARFDQYRIPNINLAKTDKKKKTVLYLPRWTGNDDVINFGNKPSSFLKLKDALLNFAETNKDVNLIIRPHPMLFDNYVRKGFMTQEEVDCFCDRIKNSDKIELDDKKDYFDSLINADILFADYTSLLAEYFVLDRPVVFFGTVGKQASEMFETFYRVTSWEQVEKVLSDLINGIDPKKELRHKFVSDFWKKYPQNIGEKIIDIIKKDFLK